MFPYDPSFLLRENYTVALGTYCLPHLLTQAWQNGVVKSVYYDGTVIDGYRCARLEESHNSSISKITVFY